MLTSRSRHPRLPQPQTSGSDGSTIMCPISPIRELLPLRISPASIMVADRPQQAKITITRLRSSSGSRRKGRAAIFPAFSAKIRVPGANRGRSQVWMGTAVPHWGDWEL